MKHYGITIASNKKKIKKSYAPSLFLLKCLVTGVDPKDLRGGKPAEEGRQLAIFSIEQWKKTHLNQLAVIFFCWSSVRDAQSLPRQDVVASRL